MQAATAGFPFPSSARYICAGAADSGKRIAVLPAGSSRCAAGICGELGDLLGRFFAAGLHRDGAAGEPADLVLVRPAGGSSGSGVLEWARRTWPGTPVLLVLCGAGGAPGGFPDLAGKDVEDFISCPFAQAELHARVVRLLGTDREPSRAAVAPRLSFLVGESPAFEAALVRLGMLAKSDATIILQGETGTGKELFARAIHYLSRRKARAFLPMNCGSLPDHLFENELFGHAKGAFTDASTNTAGLLAMAEGGTLFLDEVDSLTPAAQVKLLRLLQDREYRPLGSTTLLRADVRIVAATNVQLRARVEQRAFREDLYHRLNVLRLDIPPLRDRPDDIHRLARHFLDRFSRQEERGPMKLSPGAMGKLVRYRWPGNVRELEAAIHRAVILTAGWTIEAESLDLPASEGEGERPRSLREAKERAVLDFERAFLVQLLSEQEGNISRAARQAGKERRAFQRLLQKHGIDRLRFQGTGIPAGDSDA